MGTTAHAVDMLPSGGTPVKENEESLTLPSPSTPAETRHALVGKIAFGLHCSSLIIPHPVQMSDVVHASSPPLVGAL